MRSPISNTNTKTWKKTRLSKGFLLPRHGPIGDEFGTAGEKIFFDIYVSSLSRRCACDKAKRHVSGVLKQAKMLEILLASVFSMVYDV